MACAKKMGGSNGVSYTVLFFLKIKTLNHIK
jgi:hypothetical protein